MPGKYTWGEVFGIAGHTVRGGRHVAVNGHEDEDGGHGERADRIHDKAEERRQHKADIAFRAVDSAYDDLYQAEQNLRMARGPEKNAARLKRNDAKARARRAEAAARRYR